MARGWVVCVPGPAQPRPGPHSSCAGQGRRREMQPGRVTQEGLREAAGPGPAGLERGPALCCPPRPVPLRLWVAGASQEEPGSRRAESGMHGRAHPGKAPGSCWKAQFEVQLL